MNEFTQADAVASAKDGVLEYDLADAIYAACLVDTLRDDSPFYFMDSEDGCTSMMHRA